MENLLFLGVPILKHIRDGYNEMVLAPQMEKVAFPKYVDPCEAVHDVLPHPL